VRGFLVVNPRSGSGTPSAEELVARAAALGVRAHVLREGDDLEALVRAADADALGMAGGDGSLAAVASVAIDRDLPFVCVPFGTRNHFARDAGLDGDDPLAALEAFADGEERRVDVGRVGDRRFLNNVSLGLYALLVHRRERHRRRGAALARLRALLLTLRDRGATQRFVVDGRPLRACVVLVGNNRYSFDLLSIGARERLDEGLLHLSVPHGLRRVTWEERSCAELDIDVPSHHVRAAIDGEPAALETPLRFAIEPGALRLLVPRSRSGAPRRGKNAADRRMEARMETDPSRTAGGGRQPAAAAGEEGA
jgi:diacylglycerol kinase family enzyme